MEANEIIINDADRKKSYIFKFNQQAFEGVYIADKKKEADYNIDSFKIKNNLNTPDGEVGVLYCKPGNVMIVSFYIKDNTDNSTVIVQVLILKGVDKLEILNCNNTFINYFTPQLMDACDLLNCETLEDLGKLERFNQ